MNWILRLFVTSFVVLCLLASSLQAENWPGWRGPRGDGTNLEKNIPVHWDGTTGKNIAWNVPVPVGYTDRGLAWSSNSWGRRADNIQGRPGRRDLSAGIVGSDWIRPEEV